MGDAPFRHASDALLYIFDPERATCDRSPASRMTDKYRGDPGALAGLDGAAEIAMAEAMLSAKLSATQLSILACRFAPPILRPIAKGDGQTRPNQQWRAAIMNAAHEAMTYALGTCQNPSYRFVATVLRKEFGKDKVHATTVGVQEGMSLGTCSKHKRLVLQWAWGVEANGFKEAEGALRTGGFIE